MSARVVPDGERISIYLDGDFTTDAARKWANLILGHADKIDREAALIAAMKRRNVVAQHYTDTAWSALDRSARTMIDRIIELENQQEENK